MKLIQRSHDGAVLIQIEDQDGNMETTPDKEAFITAGDAVMLVNYFRNCKTGTESSDYISTAEYKKAESQGAYIDRLRTKYPFRIFARGYEAVLCGVQPLLEGQETPIYRFPGGESLVDDVELKNVVEW